MLGYGSGWTACSAGIAAHHAGMLPAFKEVVEELFAAGLVKAVFATETLALGINMPARTVVLEKLDKFNGEAHADLTAGGVHPAHRPGRPARHRRRGPRGGAVAARHGPGGGGRPGRTRTYPLNSSFRPSYNMAVNLTGWAGRARAATCSSPRSPSSRPTAASSGWPGRSARTARPWTSWPRR